MDNFGRPVNRPSANPPQPTARPVEPSLEPQQAPMPSSDDTPLPGFHALTPEIAQIDSEPPQKSKKSKKKLIFWILGLIIGVVIAVAAGVLLWYNAQLAPVDSQNTNKVQIVIEPGSTPTLIANSLEEQKLIRSATAFLWYTRLEGVQNNLQAGAYRLSPSETTQEITEHLVNGKVDTFNVTLYPGATLVDNTDTPAERKYDVTTALKRAGYTQEQITEGLNADYSEYNDTLFQGRPSGADLEGYVYGETYQLSSDASVEDVLRMSFDHLWAVIKDNDLVAKYRSEGLSLYEGITLASIVQRESGGDDKEKIAQVFYTRLADGQQLGSDVTYQYITDKFGVERDINYDSPYNTRRYEGLPPGPIASPGEASLIAVGNPANTTYVYFLSGDDNITYFAHTYEEHEANIRNHCQQKCQIL